MFSRKPSNGAGKAGAAGLSFIGGETVIDGDLVSKGRLHIDGTVEGDVRCKILCQGKSGAITGSIAADEAQLAGSVEGSVEARTVTLDASARIAGDVAYETITIAAGARVDGRLSRVTAADTKDAVAVAALPAAQPREKGMLLPMPEPAKAASA